MKTVVVAALLAALPLSSAAAADLVSPFAGSEFVGEYASEYDKYYYVPDLVFGTDPVAIEGKVTSRIYRKPEAKSNFEVFRSFEQELRAAGFDMLVVSDETRNVELSFRKANNRDHNNVSARAYMRDGRATGVNDVGRAATQAQHGILARKTIDDTDVLLAVYTSKSGLYTIDQVESAVMETGTVTLNLDALRDQMASEGRVAIYGILFDTGSAVIKAESADTLATVVDYLRENTDRSFYVVGHTDDQGAYGANLALSKARAEAVRDALVEALPQASARLQAEGVGPLSPVATNQGTDGRSLNRRVELVSQLD